MGDIALIARRAGHRATGCDTNVYSPMGIQLEAQGIELIEGPNPEQLPTGADLYVTGNVISRGSPLMETILDHNLPYTPGPQWSGDNVLHQKWAFAAAGTYGKTIMTSMLAWIL